MKKLTFTLLLLSGCSQAPTVEVSSPVEHTPTALVEANCVPTGAELQRADLPWPRGWASPCEACEEQRYAFQLAVQRLGCEGLVFSQFYCVDYDADVMCDYGYVVTRAEAYQNAVTCEQVDRLSHVRTCMYADNYWRGPIQPPN